MDYKVKEKKQLLAFLLEDVPQLSRTKAKSLLKYGQISVNGKRQKAFDYELHVGSTVRIGQGTKEQARTSARLDILFENDELIVINKPDGLLSVSADGPEEETAHSLVEEYLKTKDSKSRAFVVHRLDQYTSGVLLFAKSNQLRLKLQERWNELVTERKYYAVVEGTLEKKQGVIRSWLSEGEGFVMRSSKKPTEGAKEAVTVYQVLRETETLSLLDVKLETGRKNQIRVHMYELGHPVAGDKKYRATSNPLRRLGLHAYKLALRHPETEELLSFQTQMPKSFRRVMKDGAEEM